MLESSRPHYIRCVKPNVEKSPDSIDAQLVLEQLRYSGVLEAIKIRKQGFPFRPSHEEFFRRYFAVSENILKIVKEEVRVYNSPFATRYGRR